MLLMCYQYFAVSEDKGVVFDLADLIRVTYTKDSKLADFMASWRRARGDAGDDR
jgi:hypothetical protein